MKHIDEWVEDHIYGEATKEEKYAVAFFFLKGMDAVSNQAIAPILDQHKLFCTYENQTYRVTGCSRLGDVWIHTNMDASHGYTNRVDIDKCSNWSPNYKENT